MATPKSTYAIELKDETSGPASDAARALSNLRAKIDADIKALRDMQAAMKRLQSGSSVNVAAFRELNARISAQKDAIAQAESSYLQLGGTFRGLGPRIRGVVAPTNATTGSFDRLLSRGRKIPGPLGGIVDAFDDLRDVVSVGGVAGPVGLVAAALAAVAAVAIAAAVAVTKYAIASADAHRSERLRLEGLLALDGAQSSLTARASALQASIDRVSGSVAIGRADVERYARELHRAGLRGEALSAALEGASITAAVQGNESASAFVKQAKALRGSARAVRELASETKTRLGGIAARQMLSLDVQVSKLKENLAALFGGLELETFLGKLRELTDLFSQNTATGRALKVLAETVFQPMIDQASRLFPIAKRAFQGLVIGALHLAIAVLRVRNSFRQAFAGTSFESIDAMTLALHAGRLAIQPFADALNAFNVALQPILPALNLAARYYDNLAASVRAAWDEWKALDLSSIGISLVDGLIGGIAEGRERLLSTIRTLGVDARNTLVSVLEIGSPSRVFAELGMQIPRGLAQGVQQAAPIAAGAIEDLGGVPTLRSAPSSTTSIAIGDIHVHMTGAPDAGAIAERLRDELARVLDGVAVEMGAPAT